MKKKTTGLLCLAASLLVGAAVVAPTSIAIAKAAEGDVSAAAEFAVVAPAIDGITFTVPANAKAGSVVDVHIVINDHTKVDSIGDLRVNGKKASKIDEDDFSFVMPNANANLTLEVEAHVNAHNIGAVLPNGMHLEGLPAAAEAGQAISFAITFDAYAGIAWDGTLDIYTGDDKAAGKVNYAEADGLFTFTMPDADITVAPGSEARSFKLSRAELGTNDEADGYEAIGEIAIIDGDQAHPLIADNASLSTKKRAAFGSTVRVNMKSFITYSPRKAYNPLGLMIMETGETFMLADFEGDYVEFPMPGRDITIQAILEERKFEIDCVGGDHTSIEVYHKVENDDGSVSYVLDDGVKPLVGYYEDVYVKVVSNDPAYGCGALALVTTGGSYNINRTVSQATDSGFYVFTVNDIYETITLTVTEKAALAADPTMNLDAAAHLTGAYKVYDGEQLVAVDANHRIIPGTDLYVEFAGENGEFCAKELIAKYKDAADGDDKNLTATRVNANLYRVSVPAEALSLSFVVSEQRDFTNSGLVGEYVGKGVNVSTSAVSNLSYEKTVKPAGTFAGTAYNDGYGIQTITPAADGAGYGTFTARRANLAYSGGYVAPESQESFTNEQEYLFAYGEKVIMWQGCPARAAGDNVESPIVPNGTDNINFMFKKAETTETLEFKVFKLTDEHDASLLFGQATYGDDVYANIFVNLKTGEYKIDNQLEFEFSSGNKISDDNAMFDVKYAGNTLYRIGTKANGDKTFLDDYYGSYSIDGEADALLLDGAGNATYGGNAFVYKAEADQLTLTRNYDDAGKSYKQTVVLTLDTENKAAVVNSDNSVEIEYVINLKPTGATYGFRDNGDGTYTSDNHNIHSSDAIMEIEARKAGKLTITFDVGAESYDFLHIQKNGTDLAGYTKLYNESNKKCEVIVAVGDKIRMIFHKDYSNSTEPDCVVVKGFAFVAAGEEAGTYAYTYNGTNMSVTLDGFGNGYTYDADAGTISFGTSYRDVNGNSPWQTKSLSVVANIDTKDKTLEVTDSTLGDALGQNYKGYNLYSTGVENKEKSAMYSTFNVSATDAVTGTKSGAISEYNSTDGTLKVGTNYAFYEKDMDTFWMAYGSNATGVGTDTYIFFNDSVASVSALKYSNSNNYIFLMKVNYVDGTSRYLFGKDNKLYPDVTFDGDFPTSTSTSITILDNQGNQLYSK